MTSKTGINGQCEEFLRLNQQLCVCDQGKMEPVIWPGQRMTATSSNAQLHNNPNTTSGHVTDDDLQEQWSLNILLLNLN